MYQQLSNNADVLKKKFRRVLLNGPPNSGKTSSLRTWPTPTVGLVYPKEKGASSLSLTATDGGSINAFVPPDIDVSKPQDWAGICAGMVQTTKEILAGKHGPVTTFFGDGLHKAYQIFLAKVCGGSNFTAEEFDPKLYVRSHALFFEYVDMVLSSAVPYVVLTCWDGAEQDNPLDQSKEGKANKHLFPDLPGQASKKIMGEFALVLKTNIEGVGKSARYIWQTQPGGYSWGAGMKLPIEIASKLNIPREVEQNFTVLDQKISKAIDEAYNGKEAA